MIMTEHLDTVGHRQSSTKITVSSHNPYQKRKRQADIRQGGGRVRRVTVEKCEILIHWKLGDSMFIIW